MAKKQTPVKLIIKFSNDSTANKEKGKKKGKTKKSGPCGSDSPRNHTGASKLKS